MTRITRLFERLKAEGKTALVAYITAGDPTPERTDSLVAALERGGADLIELGVPFSDPIADGPVIQRAGDRALRAGTTLKRVLDIACQIRKRSEVPILLFTYLNPVLRYGLEKLATDAAAAGIDGCLLTERQCRRSGNLHPRHAGRRSRYCLPRRTNQQSPATRPGRAIFKRLRLPGLSHRRYRRTGFHVPTWPDL